MNILGIVETIVFVGSLYVYVVVGPQVILRWEP